MCTKTEGQTPLAGSRTLVGTYVRLQRDDTAFSVLGPLGHPRGHNQASGWRGAFLSRRHQQDACPAIAAFGPGVLRWPARVLHTQQDQYHLRAFFVALCCRNKSTAACATSSRNSGGDTTDTAPPKRNTCLRTSNSAEVMKRMVIEPSRCRRSF